MSQEKDGDLAMVPVLNLTQTKIAESRLIEAKTVNAATYADLSYCFNESYRELKKALAEVGHRLGKANKRLDEAKSRVLIDELPEFIKEKKLKDTSETRMAYMVRDPEISSLMDQVNTMEAMEKLIEGKIKVMERACHTMNKQMDIAIKSGMDYNLYGDKSGK